MKKNILSMAALLMASAAVFTACSSDDNITSEQPANPTGKYTMTVQASKDGDATTRALTLDGNTLNATWATTENVYVKKGSDWATGSLKPQADGATATLKGTLSGIKINVSDVLTLQFPKSGEPVYTGQVGTLADIAANFDYATATVTVNNVDGSGNITVNEPATFTNQQSIVKFTLKNGETLLNAGTVKVQATYGVSTPIFDIVFTIPNDTYTTNGNGVIYLAIPNTGSYFSDLVTMYGYTLATIKSYCRLNITATVGSDTYTYTKNGWPFDDGKYYEITVKMTKPEVASKYFTSKSDGTKVVFSPGNLQYQASTDTWRFAEHQYDYVGDATNGNVYVGSTKSNNANISSTYDGWIDLFGWGTSNKTFASGYGSATQPWSTSMEGTDYGPTGTSNGLYGDFANGDWGVNMTGPYTWRTLTGGSGGEWEYIFSTRTSGATVNGTSNARYTEATINTDGTPVNGIILFPDGCNINSSSATSWGNINSASTWDNATKCTTSQWTHLEELGCVFLPAAGLRDGTKAYQGGLNGIYCSSSPYAKNPIYSHHVRIYSGGVEPAIWGNRFSGFSVRLVRVVE